jgi:hypothetical protein
MELSVMQGMIMEERTVLCILKPVTAVLFGLNYPGYGKNLALITNPLDFHNNHYAMLIAY